MDENIENFLNPRRDDGAFVSTGHFTILTRKAHEKSARYRLQNWGAWAVKILQALTAAGVQKEVTVIFDRKVIRFEFELPRSFQRSKLHELLSTSSSKTQQDVVLDHLRVGLTSVAHGEHRALSVHLWVSDEPLFWNSEKFCDTFPRAFRKSKTRMSITVAHLTKSERAESSWALRKSLTSERILEASSQISSRFLAAPFLLKMDGWKYHYGMQLSQHLEEMGEQVVYLCLSRKCPQWDTYSGHTQRVARPVFVVGAAKRAIDSPLILAYAFSFPKDLVQGCDPEDAALAVRPSICYWLKDGALVGEDALASGLTSLRLTVFADAGDLSTDVGTLALNQNEARVHRLRLVEDAAREDITKRHGKARLKIHTQHPLSNSVAGVAGGTGVAFLAASAALLSNPWLLPVYTKLVFGLVTPFGATGAALSQLLSRRKKEPISQAFLDDEWERFLACWAKSETEPKT